MRTSSAARRGFSDGNRWESACWSVTATHMKWKRNNPSYAGAPARQIPCHVKAAEGVLLASKGVESRLSKSLLGFGVVLCVFLKPQCSVDDTEVIAGCVSHFNLQEIYQSDELNLVFSIYCSTIKTHYYLLWPTIPHFFRLKNCMWPLNQ